MLRIGLMLFLVTVGLLALLSLPDPDSPDRPMATAGYSLIWR
ncbi:hypothetical protein CI1B_02450 [Bradyrhizobium ivorense]|uniref:Uncharacterized protein n=1 Tax=Bradyrhizobium ivorense TaxID=2511166 RepID=A0A508SVM3_9BRAD|nr:MULTISPECIES: hypothetical protein [Bradyrhizobium]VIO65148.1 hypothetical protein CI1B_02450 [Bradyrhizobium ivorense]VIO71994.1 hypothetical protein CI41S_33610 [Bradyrhizobium ivorense]